MKKIHVKASTEYDILIERGLIEKSGEKIASLTKSRRALIVTDSNLRDNWAEKVANSMKSNGFNVFVYTFPAGEKQKQLSTVCSIVGYAAKCELTRSDIIVAVGGGVTGDMAGFAAAIYMRGIDFVQIPTSLLAQVDSSVGGKTGCDLPEGKNLAGAFKQPVAVLIDPDTLSTLPHEFFSDGMGEVIKYGCIWSRDFFEKLESEDINGFIDDLIYYCVDIKRQVVEQDEFESGCRMLLNFGHTLGHAIESYYGFDGISHGHAVGIGMLRAAKIGIKLGITPQGTDDRIEALIKKFDMPLDSFVPNNKLVSFVMHDKKRNSSATRFVLLNNIGSASVKEFNSDELAEILS